VQPDSENLIPAPPRGGGIKTLGEIYYRGSHYPAPHPPLITSELFERTQQILQERGDNASLRRSNQSDYLLTGLIRCSRCG